jgi:GAF domain-containing protein
VEKAEELVRRLQRLELIHAVSRELNNSLDAESLIPKVLSLTLGAVQAEAGSLWLLHGDKIVCEHAVGGAGESIVGLELPRGAGIVGSVAEKRAPEVVLDASQDPRFVKQVDEATGFVTRSVITVPLLNRGICLGSLQILNKKGEGGRFTREDAELLREIAMDAAAAVRNSQLARTERQAREMRALLRMSREITSTLDLDRLLTTAVNILSGIVKFDRCSLALDRKGALEVVAVSGKETVDRADPGVKALADLAGWLRNLGATVYSPGPETFREEAPEKADRFARHAEATGMKGVLAVPLKDDSGFIGMLTMEAAAEDFLEDGQQELVETYANQVAVALRNADLYRQTPLVGMFQRRGGSSLGGAAGGGLWANRKFRRAAVAAGVALVLCLIPVPRSASGEAEVLPARRVHLRTEASLVVERIDVEEGQEVQEGQRLGLLRTEELEARKSELDGALRTARAEAVRFDAAGRPADARAARDREAFVRAQLESTERRLAACNLVSPVRGFVLTRRPRDLVGSVAEAGRTVLEVAEAGRWVVEIKVPQDQIPPVAPGQPASFSTAAIPGAGFDGKVLSIGVVAETAGGETVFPVVAEVPDVEGRLRSGMHGRGHVRLGTGLLGGRLFGGFLRWLRWKVGV